MKKITYLLLLLTVFSGAYARTVEVEAAYTGASHFDQAQVNATMAPTLDTLVGLEVKVANERAFKRPVYSVAVPVSLDLDIMRISVRPFYYVKNKSHEAAYQNASAYGINAQFRMTMRDDDVNEIYSHAFLGASLAQQEGTVFYTNRPDANRYYSQAAYSLGFSNTFFNTFGLDIMGTMFQYPDGISHVAGLRSVMNQQELASLQTLDIVHNLTKYTLGTQLTRMWPDNRSSLYLGYRYGEFHTAAPEHSVIIGNSFMIDGKISVDLAYNHVRNVHNHNRRDIWFLQLGCAF